MTRPVPRLVAIPQITSVTPVQPERPDSLTSLQAGQPEGGDRPDKPADPPVLKLLAEFRQNFDDLLLAVDDFGQEAGAVDVAIGIP